MKDLITKLYIVCLQIICIVVAVLLYLLSPILRIIFGLIDKFYSLDNPLGLNRLYK